MDPSRRYLIVDGHSILHAWPELRVLNRNPAKRQMAKDRLLQRLRHYQDMSGERVVVVFDGTTSRITEQREPQGLQVFYADAGSTADTVIERLVAKHAKQHTLRAATGDGMIRETVDAFGGSWISAETLLTIVEQAEGEMRKQIGK
jgi:uncharacterized protein